MLALAVPFVRAPLELLAIIVVATSAIALVIAGRRAAARAPDRETAINEASGGAIVAGLLVFIAMLWAAVDAQPKYDEPLLERCIGSLNTFDVPPDEVASEAAFCLDTAKESQDANNAPD
jgi:hypothetical protein